MSQNDVALIACGTIDASIIPQNVLRRIRPDVAVFALVMTTITAHNLHFQYSRYYLAIVAIFKSFESFFDRVGVQLSALSSPSIALPLIIVFVWRWCVNSRKCEAWNGLVQQ